MDDWLICLKNFWSIPKEADLIINMGNLVVDSECKFLVECVTNIFNMIERFTPER